MELLDVDFVITVDRSLMTNHHGKEFIGFMTTGPAVGLPEPIWMWISAPKPKVDKYGRPREAPYGLRKIEAALQDAGFKAAIIDPDYVEYYIPRAKALLIGHHDYFAFNPPSSEWWLVTGKEPVNRKSFLSFMSKVAKAKRELNPRLKIIVGGPAAWQWLYVPDLVKEFMVDTIVEGEAERLVIRLAENIIEGRSLPRYISMAPQDAPSLEEIPAIKAPSVNGLIEIMRGCPRGCKFCSVTLRPLRHYPLDKIEEELRVNYEYGIRDGIIHSEDVLLYGSSSVIPNPDALIKLHKLVKKYYRTFAWSHATLAGVVYAQEKYKLITRITEIVFDEHQDYFGFQTGIETGSPELAKKVMPAKAAPYPAEKWPDIVEEAFSILHEHRIIPAATIIVGLPGETVDDIVKTTELVERLRPYRSLIVPMFFVPMGVFRNKDWYTGVNIGIEHAELLLATLRHSVYWAKDIISKFYLRGAKYAPLRFLLNLFLDRASKFAEKLTPEKILGYIEESKERMAQSTRVERDPILKRVREAIKQKIMQRPVPV
ncbi:MAG: radical SAM protein [Pyrodictiaceae archaeon]